MWTMMYNSFLRHRYKSNMECAHVKFYFIIKPVLHMLEGSIGALNSQVIKEKHGRINI